MVKRIVFETIIRGFKPLSHSHLIIIEGGDFIGKLIDLTGKIFGNLTVLNKEPSKNKKTLWRCLCVCGNEKIVRGDSLERQAPIGI